MALWNVDLTTEDGALGAAQMGGFACFVAAVLGLVGVAALFIMGTVGGSSTLVLAGAAVALAEVVLFTITGLRLRAGKGEFWGYAAAIMLALELLMKIVSISFIGIMIDIVLLIALGNGIRGARALRKLDMGPDEVAEVFK